MRIGILVHHFPVRSQTFVVDHAAELLRRGHEVVVIPLMSYSREPWDAPPAVVDVIRATAPSPAPRRRTRNPAEGLSIVARAAARRDYAAFRFALEREGAPRGLRNRLLLAERVRRSGPFDVVHVQFAWAAPAAIGLTRRGFLDAPMVCSIHGQDANVTGREHPGWLKAISAHMAYMTAGSSFMQGVVSADGVSSDQIRVWPQGVDVERAHGHVARRDGEFRVLSVGRLVEFKGVDDSLRVIAAARDRIPGLRYTVVGDGPLRASLEALAQELSVADITSFAGAQNHDEVLAAHATSDAYLQMGKRAADGSTEGQGVAPCEAAASGLPTIATRSGGLVDVVVEGETGLLCDVGDVATAADNLARVANDPALAARLGAAARAHMRANYSIASTTDTIEAIYRSAIPSAKNFEHDRQEAD